MIWSCYKLLTNDPQILVFYLLTHALPDKLEDLDRQIEAMKAAALAEKNGGASGGKASDGLAARTAAVQAKIAEMDKQKRESEEQVVTLNLS